MNDKDFAIEFVHRIKYDQYPKKSNRQLVEVVLKGKRLNEDDFWFSDIQIERLYSGNNVYQDVYKFVRDNQHLFVKEEK